MLAKIVNWLTGDGKETWKTLLVLVGLCLLFVGIITGVLWYLVFGALFTTPKMISDLQKSDKALREKEAKIEEDRRTKQEKVDEDYEKKRQEIERKRKEEERVIDQYPQTKTPEEIKKQILEETDKE